MKLITKKIYWQLLANAYKVREMELKGQKVDLIPVVKLIRPSERTCPYPPMGWLLTHFEINDLDIVKGLYVEIPFLFWRVFFDRDRTGMGACAGSCLCTAASCFFLRRRGVMESGTSLGWKKIAFPAIKVCSLEERISLYGMKGDKRLPSQPTLCKKIRTE